MKKAEEGTCSGFMRRTRSEGFHGGKTGSGTARRRELELRREALEKLEELESLVRSVSRVREEVLVVVVVVVVVAAAEPEFLRCGGTYDIVLLSLLVRKVSLEIERTECLPMRGSCFVFVMATQQRYSRTHIPLVAHLRTGGPHGLVLGFMGFT
jgi:hypothetical protein